MQMYRFNVKLKREDFAKNTYKRGLDIEMFFYDEETRTHDFAPYDMILCEGYFESYKNDPKGRGIFFQKRCVRKRRT